MIETPTVTTPDNERKVPVNLPTIDIPKFDGEYTSWRSFHDMFVSLIHSNNKIVDVQKLHYLKASLSGEAERMLRQFDITSSNYQKAWDTLTKRYQNQRVLVFTQLKMLFNQTQIKQESDKAIRNLLDKTQECLHELNALGVPTDDWDPVILYLITQRLPDESRSLWEQEISKSTTLPPTLQLFEFLESRYRTLEALVGTANNKIPKIINRTTNYHIKEQQGCLMCRGNHTLQQCKGFQRLTTQVKRTFLSEHKICFKCLKQHLYGKCPHTNCKMCKDVHFIYKCKLFQNLGTKERRKYVANQKLCFNCLSPHDRDACPSERTCFKCGKRHNTLLHEDTPVSETINKAVTQATSSTTNCHYNRQSPQALLATAMVIVEVDNGRTLILRALIDLGSQSSFITEASYQLLHTRPIPTSLQITGLGSSKVARSSKEIEFTLKSQHDQSFNLPMRAYVIKRITNISAPERCKDIRLDCLKGLQLADHNFLQSSKIDLLIGVNAYARIIKEGIRHISNTGLVAQQTRLGWILFGETPSNDTLKKQEASSTFSTFTNSEAMDARIDTMVRKFWEDEELMPKRNLTKEENECELFYTRTHTRLEDGRYQVRLPFKNEGSPQLGESRNMALNRFFQIEKKCERDPEFKTLYTQCMNEYEELGHMVPLKKTYERNIVQGIYLRYYLPHHAVIKESSTTKLRVVFDASAKTSNERSLNEQMMTGPTLQPKLFSTLMKWRKHKYALNADIEKMYRMIRIHPDDQRYQTIFWRDTKTAQLKEYELVTVTFGTTAAPYLAIKTIQQLAIDDNKRFPVASKTVLEDLYVDDVLTGADTISQALNLQQELIALFKGGGFKLRKWAANHTSLLENIPPADREIDLPLIFEEGNEIKALGIQWHPAADQFSFAFKADNVQYTTRTKRKILSELVKLFDPLGWIAPCIILAKILIQKLWISGCSWDENVPLNISNEWTKFKDEMHHFNEVKIPRWVNLHPGMINCQIHGFCDASTQAVAAIVYLRVTHTDGKIYTNLVISKTRVAPIKPVSIPRLELCGAVLLSKLITQVRSDMQLCDVKAVSWSDSKIVLAWIKGHPNKWRTYVANRVVEIQENSRNNVWRYIPTKDNPADIASRGIMPSSIVHNNSWWNGPSWLSQAEEVWPKSNDVCETDLETKSSQVLLTMQQKDEFILLRKYSSFDKLLRITAYCRRFLYKRGSEQQSSMTYPKVRELKEATTAIIRCLQKEIFQSEYCLLQTGKPITKNSILIRLNPFIDKEGVLRVGGRLEHSNLPYDTKHPIILPSKHHITDIIILKYHMTTLHGGAQLVLNTLRTKYWIINGASTVKAKIFQCVTCTRHRHHNQTQIMGNLPIQRVTQARPFENTGLDYAGPIDLKMSKHRGAKIYKGYICLFVCMATKAIHIEAVSDLTSEAFLAAFRRFTSRRGLCTNLYSDNGTTFIGADRILKRDLIQAIREANEQTACITASEGVNWHFNPPLAPHFGGLWEAGVKSVKHHLKKTVGQTVLTFEELSTLLTQIEAVLNSRPLCSLSNDPTNLDVLAPGPLEGSSSAAETEPLASTSEFILEKLKELPPTRLEEKRYDLTTTEGKQFQVSYHQMKSIPWDAIRSGKRKRYTVFLVPTSKVRLRIRKNKIIWSNYHSQ